MGKAGWQFVRVRPAMILGAILVIPLGLSAQSHIVSPAEIQKEAVSRTRTRQDNLKTVNRFFSSPDAQKALRAAHLDPTRVKTAVASLSDEELARIASRTEKAQADFAAGDLSDRDLLLILVFVAALILIIVAVR